MINFVVDVTLLDGATQCPKCGYRRESPGRQWGTRFILCKPCQLKEDIIESADPKPKLVPYPKTLKIYPRR